MRSADCSSCCDRISKTRLQGPLDLADAAGGEERSRAKAAQRLGAEAKGATGAADGGSTVATPERPQRSKTTTEEGLRWSRAERGGGGTVGLAHGGSRGWSPVVVENVHGRFASCSGHDVTSAASAKTGRGLDMFGRCKTKGTMLWSIHWDMPTNRGGGSVSTVGCGQRGFWPNGSRHLRFLEGR